MQKEETKTNKRQCSSPVKLLPIFYAYHYK